ncbi:MAG: hypothetical protein J1D88_09470 [Treponema sp.]|nr:hypothetical protein [Treponema sp.]
MNILYREPCTKKAKPKIAPDAEGWYDFSEICPLSSDRETFELCRVCCSYRVPQQGFKLVPDSQNGMSFFRMNQHIFALSCCARHKTNIHEQK